MNNKDIDLQRMYGLFGMMAPLVGLGVILISSLMLPWFSWQDNYISDIGGHPESSSLWTTHGAPSVIFNFGLVAAGVLGILFGFGFRKSALARGRTGGLGAVFLIMGAVALVGIGLFTETTVSLHTFFFITFLILVGLAFMFISLGLFLSGERRLGLLCLFLLIFGLCALPLFFIPKPVGSNAIAEIIPIFSVSIFCVVFGYLLFSGESDDLQRN
jgi:hypothetical membrane protein